MSFNQKAPRPVKTDNFTLCGWFFKRVTHLCGFVSCLATLFYGSEFGHALSSKPVSVDGAGLTAVPSMLI